MDTVGGYLEALRTQDWDALRALLAPDVVRHGPYGDDFADRDAYVAFLVETFADARRLRAGGAPRASGRRTAPASSSPRPRPWATQRLRTEEAVVFAVHDGLDPRGAGVPPALGAGAASGR